MLEKVLVSCMTYESWTEITSAQFANNIVPKVYKKIPLIWMTVFKLSSIEIV